MVTHLTPGLKELFCTKKKCFAVVCTSNITNLHAKGLTRRTFGSSVTILADGNKQIIYPTHAIDTTAQWGHVRYQIEKRQSQHLSWRTVLPQAPRTYDSVSQGGNSIIPWWCPENREQTASKSDSDELVYLLLTYNKSQGPPLVPISSGELRRNQKSDWIFRNLVARLQNRADISFLQEKKWNFVSLIKRKETDFTIQSFASKTLHIWH